jgi:hypothetical protein
LSPPEHQGPQLDEAPAQFGEPREERFALRFGLPLEQGEHDLRLELDHALWLTLYFTVAVWVSIALPQVPRLKGRAFMRQQSVETGRCDSARAVVRALTGPRILDVGYCADGDHGV